MKLKGIIPEVKMSEIAGGNYHICKLKPYPIVSVNTSSLFNGDIELLKRIRWAYPKKFLIRKDFIMIPAQIRESKEAGADAILIIRDFLTNEQYDKLIYKCMIQEIVPITEVHNSYCEDAWKIREPILVNSRNLNTGELNRNQAITICKAFKEGGKNVIYASGESSDRMIRRKVADAVLVGTAFMRGKLK